MVNDCLGTLVEIMLKRIEKLEHQVEDLEVRVGLVKDKITPHVSMWDMDKGWWNVPDAD